MLNLLVFYVVFCRSLFVFLSFVFGDYIVYRQNVLAFRGTRIHSGRILVRFVMLNLLVFYVVFCRSLFVFLSFVFGDYIVYRQNFLAFRGTWIHSAGF